MNVKPEQTDVWQVRATEVRFENKIMRLREDTCELPGGVLQKYAYVERGEAVIVVPITKAGEMVLLWQYRHPVREYCLEVPAGTTADAEGQSLEEVVRKELKEEVGATCGRVEKITSIFSNSSLSDEQCHVFLATEVELSEEAEPEAGEQIETKLVPVSEGVALAQRGEMKTSPTALAVLLCVPRLQELGLL